MDRNTLSISYLRAHWGCRRGEYCLPTSFTFVADGNRQSGTERLELIIGRDWYGYGPIRHPVHTSLGYVPLIIEQAKNEKTNKRL